MADFEKGSTPTTPTRPSGSTSGGNRVQQAMFGLDAFSLDTMLPEMNWVALEQSLREAVNCRKPEYSQMLKQNILDSLAKAESNFGGGRDDTSNRGGSSRVATRMLRPHNSSLQICFLNESSEDSEVDSLASQSQPQSPGLHNSNYPRRGRGGPFSRQNHRFEDFASDYAFGADFGQRQPSIDDEDDDDEQLQFDLGGGSAAPMETATTIHSNKAASSSSSAIATDLDPALTSSSNMAESTSTLGSSAQSVMAQSILADDFIATLVSRYNLLRKEANIAYAQAARMAVMQLQIEKAIERNRKQRPATEIVPGFTRWFRQTVGQTAALPKSIAAASSSPHLQRYLWSLSRQQLDVMLKQIVKEFSSQSDELVKMLTEREGLFSRQDALLVEIDDESKRLQDKADKLRANGQLMMTGSNSMTASMISSSSGSVAGSSGLRAMVPHSPCSSSMAAIGHT